MEVRERALPSLGMVSDRELQAPETKEKGIFFFARSVRTYTIDEKLEEQACVSRQ